MNFKKNIFQIAIIFCVIYFFVIMAFAADTSSFNLNINIVDYTVAQLNSCENHKWIPQDWGADFSLTHGTFHGRKSLRADVTVPDAGWALFQTDGYVQPENWFSYNRVRVDVYIESGSNKGFELVLFNNSNTELFRQSLPINFTPGSWQTVEWSAASFPSSVSRVDIVFTSAIFQAGDKVYFNNLRIGQSSGSFVTWEMFDAPGYFWSGDGDFVPWSGNGRNEPVTREHTYNSSAGALVLPWSSAHSGALYAKMQANYLHGMNYSGNTRVRMRIRSDNNSIPIYVEFWDGNIHNTSAQTVAAINTWESITWDIPLTVNLSGLLAFSIMLDTSIVSGAGKIHIDDIEFLP